MAAISSPPPLSDAERGPTSIDLAVLALMVVLGCLGILLAHDYAEEGFTSRLVPWADYVAFVVLVLPIAWRRRAPAAVCLWVGVGFAVFRLLEVPEGPVSSVAVFLGIHAAGAYLVEERVRVVVRGLALTAGCVALTYSLFQEAEAVSFDSLLGVTFSIGLNAAFYVVAWVLGDATRRRRIDQAELTRRAEQLAEEREARAEQAVTAERVRIARELHDVVAHHVSVMGVQAAAARHVLDRDVDRAAEALAHVEDSGRQAVDELQRLVGILRSDRPGGGVDEPQPTLDGLGALIDSMANAGLGVELRVIGRERPLPSSVELSAYRIVQEALTNVLRHAPGARTTVVLSHLSDALQVEVVNSSPTSEAPQIQPGGGRGLVGMRERAAMLGGTLEHGPVPRGGYRVRATLPTASSQAEAGVLTR